MDILTLPNALSASRLAMAPLVFVAIRAGAWEVAAGVFLLAVATDMADGWLARRFAQVTPMGGLLDHGADAIFVTSALTAIAIEHLIPPLLPALIAVAFTQYMVDSNALAGRPLRGSSLGRYNGISYFVLAAFFLLQRGMSIELVPEEIGWWLAWCLIATTLFSMAGRLMALIRQ